LILVDTFVASDAIVFRLATNHQSITSSFVASQTLRVNRPFHVDVTQGFNANQLMMAIHAYVVSLTDTFTASDTVTARNSVFHGAVTDTFTASQKLNLYHYVTVTDTFTASHVINIYRVLIPKKLTNKLTVTTAFAYSRDIIQTLTDTLNITNEMTRNLIYTPRTLEDLEHVSDTWSVTLLVKMPHPVVTGVPIIRRDMVTLEAKNGGIVLPLPEFGDTVRNSDSVNIKRSLNGLLYAYVRSGQTSVIHYEWVLDLRKAQELRVWLGKNQSEVITMSNWKGEVWRVQITSQNIPFTNEARYAGDARQKVTASLDFEGKKLYG